jgi:hypothetical protein
MMRASSYRAAGRQLYPQRNGQLRPAMHLAGGFLALLSLLFGIAFSAYVPSSLEQRIGGLFFFGLIPAVGLYIAGHILGHWLMLGTALCELAAARCLRCFAILSRKFVCWVQQVLRDLSIRSLIPVVRCHLTKLSDVREEARQWFIELRQLLIRSGARFVIVVQTVWAPRVSDLPRSGWLLRSLITKGMFLLAFGLGWCAGNAIWPLELSRDDPIGAIATDAIVERIIRVESNGDPNARNKRSSATGPAQFLDATWLELIRAHRPDLAQGISQDKTLELRRDANLAREMTLRFTEQNTDILRKRGLPVTPGTLYLAHFAGGAGAVAILSASDGADAAAVMASADPTGRTKREKVVKANPFLERFTIVDLRNWADRRMRVPPG